MQIIDHESPIFKVGDKLRTKSSTDRLDAGATLEILGMQPCNMYYAGSCSCQECRDQILYGYKYSEVGSAVFHRTFCEIEHDVETVVE